MKRILLFLTVLAAVAIFFTMTADATSATSNAGITASTTFNPVITAAYEMDNTATTGTNMDGNLLNAANATPTDGNMGITANNFTAYIANATAPNNMAFERRAVTISANLRTLTAANFRAGIKVGPTWV
ncbi:MAG TPA: hypothetical protein VJG65_01020 [Patescibacteria group bacterium]|nr:hypothetical protein [Patescibacteria group bacterium]